MRWRLITVVSAVLVLAQVLVPSARVRGATPHRGAGPAAASLTPLCPGDCDGGGRVTVDEILTMVDIALGNADIGGCLPGDVNSDNQITVDEILTAVNSALNGCPQGTPIEQALRALSAGNLHSANARFCQAAVGAASDDPANLYCAVTRIITKVMEDPSIQSLLQRSGVMVTGDTNNVCGLRATRPQEVPNGAPSTGEILVAVRALLLPEIDTAVSTIQQLSDAMTIVFNLGNLPYCLQGRFQIRDIEIDHSDVLVLKAALRGARAALDILAAYNLDVTLQNLVHHTPQSVLAVAPNLLTLVSAASLGTARQEVDDALASMAAAITSALVETDDQSNDLLVIAPRDRDGAARTVRVLDLVRQSLQGQVVLSTDVGLKEPFRLDLSMLSSGQFTTLRPFLPIFDARGRFDLAHFPDSTFGGTAPDLTQLEISRALLGDDCGYDVPAAASEAECDAAASERSCRSSYFYAGPGYSGCYLSGCVCGWPGN